MAQGEEHRKADIVPFASEMKKLINHKESSDIKFLIGPNRKAVHAHCCILSARCEVFRAMFADKSVKPSEAEVPLVLSDTTPEVFTAMLEFIYTNCVTLNGKIAIDVLGSGIEYGLDGLRGLCVDYLVDHLSVSSACEAMQAAVTYGQDELQKKTLEYIEGNTTNVFKSKSFHEMSDAALAVVLKSDGLHMDEKDILEAVREWATVSAVVMNKSRSAVAAKVIRHVRLPLLEPGELKVVEEENEKDKLIPVDHISYAWKRHALKAGDPKSPLVVARAGTRKRDHHSIFQQ